MLHHLLPGGFVAFIAIFILFFLSKRDACITKYQKTNTINVPIPNNIVLHSLLLETQLVAEGSQSTVGAPHSLWPPVFILVFLTQKVVHITKKSEY